VSDAAPIFLIFSRAFSDQSVRHCFRLAFPKPSRPDPQKERRLSLGTPELGEGGSHPGSKKRRSVN